VFEAGFSDVVWVNQLIPRLAVDRTSLTAKMIRPTIKTTDTTLNVSYHPALIYLYKFTIVNTVGAHDIKKLRDVSITKTHVSMFTFYNKKAQLTQRGRATAVHV